MAPDLHAAAPRNSPARDAAVILLILAVIAGLGLAVSWPWLPFFSSETSLIERYSPLRDGSSSLTVKEDPDGQIVLWQGANNRVLRNAEGYATEISRAARTAIEKLYTKDEEKSDTDFVALTRGATFIQQRVTELDTAGVVSHTTTLFLRNAAGEHIVSFNADDVSRESALTPPALFLPADAHAGETWQSTGQIGASIRYTVTGSLLAADPYKGELGSSADCLQADVRVQFGSATGVFSDVRSRNRLCAGIGSVDEVELKPAGEPGAYWRRIASSTAGSRPVAAKLPPAPKAGQPAPDMAGTANWTMTRLGRVATGINVGPTIAPTYVAADPPLLLVATYENDLVALDPSNIGGDAWWRFDPTGTVFGQPAYDPARGRIYFGASDKQLYALDVRGLFIWAYPTGDNVAAKPVVYGDLVIFASEDRNAYAVEADTGKLRWQHGLGSAAVASPALAQVTIDGARRDVVIFGSDDGAVLALDAASGEPLWSYDAGKAVEAAIMVDGSEAFVASTAGAIVALDAATGGEQWTADLTNTHAIRNPVALTTDRVYVVDELGYLTALARTGGRWLWQSRETDYFGAPLAAGDELLVGSAGINVVRVGPDGVRRGAWSITSTSDATDTSPRVDFGPAVGGGALWLVDGHSVVRRIGAPQPGPERLPLTWVRSMGEPPFAMDLVRATPVQHGDGLFALDEGGRLARIDLQTGAAELQVATENKAVFLEPVLTDNLLIAASNSGLTASRLSDGATAWHIDGGASFQPPVLAGDLILWTSAGQPAGVRLAAVATGNGEIRWERTFPALSFAGGVVVAGNSVYCTSPVAAFDLQTGKTLWEASGLTNGLGSPALSTDESTVYVGRLDTLGGAIAAVNGATGEVRWEKPLAGNALSFLDRPWLVGNTLVVPTLSGSILGVNAEDGALRWQAALPGNRFGGVTVVGNRIYAGVTKGQLLILSAQDGRVLARGGDKEGGLESYSRSQRPIIQGDHIMMSFGSSLRGYTIPEGLQ